MNTSSEQAVKKYKLRIKIRLDGRYCLVLSGDKPAFVLTRDKEERFHTIPKSKDWYCRMLEDHGLLEYLTKLHQCLEAYYTEAKDLDLRRIVLMQLFSDNKSPTI